MHSEIPRIGLDVAGRVILRLYVSMVALPRWILDDLSRIIHRTGQHGEAYRRVHPQIRDWKSLQKFHRHPRGSYDFLLPAQQICYSC